MWGSARTPTTGRKSWMMIVSDHGRAETDTWYLANKMKKSTIICLCSFNIRVENQTGFWIRQVRTDGGMEFVNDL